MRRIFSFVLAVVVTVFLWTSLSGSISNAVGGASWNSNNLTYNGKTYSPQGNTVDNTLPGAPAGSPYFTYNESASKTDVIYFAPNTTASSDTNATYAVYDTDGGNSPPLYSNPQQKVTITVQANQTAQPNTSCGIQGLGWILCPLGNILATGMDWLMNVLDSFLQVQPLNVTSTSNTLYNAWSIMRNIANVAFIIVFLIIIYSQLTSFGVNNYGLKKLLPRLVIAVILVNLSYYICALAVDLSNILGYSLHGVLTSLRDTVTNTNGSSGLSGNDDWQNLTTIALAGGSAAAGLAIGGVVLNTAVIGGSFAGLFYLLLPVLVGLFLSVLVAVLILAARQALIIILTVIAPLAFVAYLLPNTEKWFTQWRKMFTTMMVFYPAFVVMFSGAQLAGMIIIKNASSITVAVLGLIVEVVPLAFTPLLLRLSGNTIQGVAKFAQGMNKKIGAQTGNWSKARRELYRQRGLATPSKNPVGLRRTAQYWHARGEAIKARTAAYTVGAENQFMKTKRYEKADHLKRAFNEDKEILEKEHSIAYKQFQQSDAKAVQREIKLRVLTDRETFQSQRLDARYEEIRADGTSSAVPSHARSTELNSFMASAQITHRDIAIQGMRNQAAKNMQQKFLAEALDQASKLPTTQFTILTQAAGIDPNGRARAVATATSALGKINTEARENTMKLVAAQASRLNKTAKEYTESIVKDALAGTAGANGYDADIIEAAFETIAQDGNISLLEEARINSRHSAEVDQSMLSEVLGRNSGTMKAKGGFHLQANPGLAGVDDTVMNRARADTFGNITANHLGDAKAGWYGGMAKNITEIIDAVNSDPNTSRAQKRASLRKIYESTHLALNDGDIRATITDRLDETYIIENAMAAELGLPPTPKED